MKRDYPRLIDMIYCLFTFGYMESVYQEYCALTAEEQEYFNELLSTNTQERVMEIVNRILTDRDFEVMRERQNRERIDSEEVV